MTLPFASAVSLALRRRRLGGLRRRALPALDVLLRRPLLSHLRLRPLRLWLRPLCLRLRAGLFDAPARLRRSLSNRLLTDSLLLRRARTHLLLPLCGLLCAQCGGLIVRLPTRLRLLPQRHLLPLRALTLGHARGPVVRRLRRDRLRHHLLLLRCTLLSCRALLFSALALKLL